MTQQPKALKRFGQNFLKDHTILDQIINVPVKIEGRDIIEVGPGRGALSQAILSKKPRRLFALEVDKRCVSYLQSHIIDDTFHLHEADASKINWPNFMSEYSIEKPIVIANLPYNVGSVLLVDWLQQAELFDQFILMFQKEVAQRICAQPNHKNYGRLSVLSQLTCGVEIEFDVEPHCFEPAPKIMSSVVSLHPKKLGDMEKSFIKPIQELTQIVFSKRRKMLRSSLKGFLNKDMLEELSGMQDLTKRPEQFALVDLCKLTDFCLKKGVL